MSTPGLSILLADDDEAVLASTGALLRHAGYQVDCVPTGTDASERIAAQAYDLVILDIHMPGNRQLEVVRAHAQADRFDGVPIMILTGNPDVSSAIEAMRHSVLDYLTKPFAPEQLLVRVEAAIAKGAEMRTLTGLQTHLGALQDLVNVLATKSAARESSGGTRRTEMALSSAERKLLSARELEVLAEVAQGSSTADIATTLFISPHTVRNHLKAIYRKLDVSSRTALMKKLLRPL